MKRVCKITVLILLTIASILTLVSCGPSLEYQIKAKQGFYPDTSEFPDTKWVCREVDMYFYMLDYGYDTMIGEYTVDEKTYRVIASFFFGSMEFDFISRTDIYKSMTETNDGSERFVFEREIPYTLCTEYIYENDVITCTIKDDAPSEIWNYEGDTLTFEKSPIVEEENPRYYCEELNMYIKEFADGYYKGEIIIDNVPRYVQGAEIGNNEYYEFYIEDIEYSNKHNEKIVDPFVDMIFWYSENKISAIVPNICSDNTFYYTYWKSDKTVFEFVEVLASQDN